MTLASVTPGFLPPGLPSLSRPSWSSRLCLQHLGQQQPRHRLRGLGPGAAETESPRFILHKLSSALLRYISCHCSILPFRIHKLSFSFIVALQQLFHLHKLPYIWWWQISSWNTQQKYCIVSSITVLCFDIYLNQIYCILLHCVLWIRNYCDCSHIN